jgi:hypothetical protein
MRFLVVVFLLVSTLLSAKPVAKAKLILEPGSGREVIAVHNTGELGKVSFNYLDAGYYLLYVEFPQQEGKYIKESTKHTTLTKVTYNGKNRTYYYQGLEGYFAVRLNGLKKMNKESVQAVFRERHKEDKLQILMAQFEAAREGASITIAVEALTASQFKKATDKLGSDISTISIQGVK